MDKIGRQERQRENGENVGVIIQYCFLSLLAQFTLLQFAHSNERNPF